jgi:hypothetical protein
MHPAHAGRLIFFGGPPSYSPDFVYFRLSVSEVTAKMAKRQVEFVNTCPCCDAHARVVEEIAGRYPDTFDVKIYRVGKDFGYLEKYGIITKGTLIIDGTERIEDLSRGVIEAAMTEAARDTEKT